MSVCFALSFITPDNKEKTTILGAQLFWSHPAELRDKLSFSVSDCYLTYILHTDWNETRLFVIWLWY